MSAASPVPEDDSSEEMAADVRAGLSAKPKRLAPKWFYDPLGSSLFEAICRLPWYPITRAEMTMLAAHGREILHAATDFSSIIELGPGSGEKLAILASAIDRP